MERLPKRASAEPPGTNRGPSRVALVGVHGFGEHHLDNLKRLQAKGLARLVAVADPHPPAPGAVPAGTAVFSNLDELLAGTPALDLVIVATPIQTHAPLALTVLEHANLYLEKPPVASLADFNALQRAAKRTGRSVQVGFQSLGSHALQAIDDLIASGEIGTLLGITATGRWVRDRAYYKRSAWAGKRSLHGVDVVDGVATNPLAHAIATALRIAGARTQDDVASVETDLYHANDIESDDTSVIRIHTATGLPITCALTLCAAETVEPYIALQGSEGAAVFHYTEDRLSVRSAAGDRSGIYGRDDLTENLLQHLDRPYDSGASSDGKPLISPLSQSGAFMRVVEAIRTAAPPLQIAERHLTWVGSGDAAHVVVAGIRDALERATASHATFSELGIPWARASDAAVARPSLRVLHDRGHRGGAHSGAGTLAISQSGASIAPRLSPRPYLHPVRTLAGVTVTDHLPADHPWHLGVGMALQDVNGSNFWGGKTFVRTSGRYEERPDHGRISEVSISSAPDYLDQILSWTAPDGSVLLRERRISRSRQVDGRTWRLDLTSELTAAVDASLGGPGSNGAAGSGYGGFFWRLAECSGADVFTAGSYGEAGSHGAVSAWLAVTADFAEGPASLVFAAPKEAQDPWFVRLAEYPGVGSSLAWDRSVQVPVGESIVRSYTVWILDGKISPAEAAGWHAGRTS